MPVFVRCLGSCVAGVACAIVLSLYCVLVLAMLPVQLCCLCNCVLVLPV